MESIITKLKQEKVRLSILKNNLNCFKEDFYVMDKFYIQELNQKGKTYYDISQNLYSLPLLLDSCYYSNATTSFFIEAFNFYQDLPKNSDFPYHIFSQSVTTYCLKELARHQMITLKSIQSDKSELNNYMEMLGNYEYKSPIVQMYDNYFYKKRNLMKKDISLLKSMMHILNIDISNLKIVSKGNKIYIRTKSRFLCHQLLSGEYFKNMQKQKEIFRYILKEYKQYLFDDDYGRKRKKKQLLK